MHPKWQPLRVQRVNRYVCVCRVAKRESQNKWIVSVVCAAAFNYSKNIIIILSPIFFSSSFVLLLLRLYISFGVAYSVGQKFLFSYILRHSSGVCVLIHFYFHLFLIEKLLHLVCLCHGLVRLAQSSLIYFRCFYWIFVTFSKQKKGRRREREREKETEKIDFSQFTFLHVTVYRRPWHTDYKRRCICYSFGCESKKQENERAKDRKRGQDKRRVSEQEGFEKWSVKENDTLAKGV